MNKLEPRIAADELIVGVRDADAKLPTLSYITWTETKAGKLNSSTSWNNWSDNNKNPIKVKNKWAKGFQMYRNNGGRGSQCRNTDRILILHPLSNTTFEIGVDNLLSVCWECNVRDEYEATL